MKGCEALLKAIDAYLTKADDSLTDALSGAGFADAAETVSEIASLEEKLAAALKTETAYIKAQARKAVDLEAFARDWPEIAAGNPIDEQLVEIFLDNFNENMPKLATAYIKRVDPQLTVATITSRTTAWAQEWSEDLAELMKLSTQNEVQRLLTSTLAEGNSVADFTRALMDSGIRDEYYRARRAALTETLRAHSVAQQEALMQNPACEDKEWVHTGGYRNSPRENHVAMHGVKVRVNEPFTLLGLVGGVYYPMYPRDTNLPPGESINCHCIHRGIANENVLGLSLEERQRLQQEAIDNDDGLWEEELNTQNKARAGISVEDVYKTPQTVYNDTESIEARQIIGMKTNNGITVENVKVHFVDQMHSRNVSVDNVISALEKPLHITDPKLNTRGEASRQYIGRECTVVLNTDTKTAVTNWPTGTRRREKLERGLLP